jgi:hypothetical protein
LTANVFFRYSEQTNPLNQEFIEYNQDVVINKDTPYSQNFIGSIPGNPFGERFGGSGQGEARIELLINDSDPDNPCVNPTVTARGTLLSFGLPYDILIDSIIQNSNPGCSPITASTFTWTGSAFPGGVFIGLVMAIFMSITFTGYV